MSELYQLPDGWEWIEFSKIFDNPTSKPFQINKTEYLESGKYPIVDQGKEFIIGYTDKEDKIYKNETNCIIFGDHTRQIKYVDFDFVVGADGTKILKEKDSKKYDIKFLYYQFTSKEIESLGYSRHFKLVKQMSFALPQIEEQKRIVSKLDLLFEKIDKSIALHQKNMDEADVFMGSVLNDVFGELEEKYEVTSLDTLSSFQNGFAFKSKEFNTDGLGLRVIRIGNVLDINKNPVFIDERKEFEKYLLKENDIVISMTGTRKKMDYLFVRVVDTNDSYLNQRVGKISSKDNSNHRYLYYYLQSNYFRDKIFEYETGTVNQGNISGKDIMNSNIPFISLEIQQKVVKYLDEISEKIEKIKSIQKGKMDSLKALKASILDRAFRGEL